MGGIVTDGFSTGSESCALLARLHGYLQEPHFFWFLGARDV